MLPGIFLHSLATNLSSADVISVARSRRAQATHDARLHELRKEANERASDDDVHGEALVHREVVCVLACQRSRQRA